MPRSAACEYRREETRPGSTCQRAGQRHVPAARPGRTSARRSFRLRRYESMSSCWVWALASPAKLELGTDGSRAAEAHQPLLLGEEEVVEEDAMVLRSRRSRPQLGSLIDDVIRAAWRRVQRLRTERLIGASRGRPES